MDTAMLGLRVVLSLACVLGLIWFAGRKLQGSAGVRRQRSVPLTVLGRQSLGKGATVALVEVAGRVLLVGVGEQGVNVLTEVDVAAAPAPAERGGEIREEIDLSTLPADLAAGIVAAGLADGVAATVPGRPDADDSTDPRTRSAVVQVPAPHADGTARLAALAGLAAGSASAGATQAGAASAAPTSSGTTPAAAPGYSPTGQAAATAQAAATPAVVTAQAAATPAVGPRSEVTAAASTTTGALHGSILSPGTWRRAAEVVQRRTAR
jgi:flagellar protein FliO/FliZ